MRAARPPESNLERIGEIRKLPVLDYDRRCTGIGPATLCARKPCQLALHATWFAPHGPDLPDKLKLVNPLDTVIAFLHV